jgi:hypothetical protein
MKLLAKVPGQSFSLAHGPHYHAGEDRVIHDVDPADVAELRRLGCTDVPAEEAAPAMPAAQKPSPELVEKITGRKGIEAYDLDAPMQHLEFEHLPEAPEQTE